MLQWHQLVLLTDSPGSALLRLVHLGGTKLNQRLTGSGTSAWVEFRIRRVGVLATLRHQLVLPSDSPGSALLRLVHLGGAKLNQQSTNVGTTE